MSATALKTLRDVPRDHRRVMTKDESRLFLEATYSQLGGERPQSAAEFRSEMDAAAAPFAIKVMAARLMLADEACRFAPSTVMFLTSLCSTPAQIVLWAHYLVRRTYELGGGVVDNHVLSSDFPMGFPTDEGMSAIWEAQKRAEAPSSNALDMALPWQREIAIAA